LGSDVATPDQQRTTLHQRAALVARIGWYVSVTILAIGLCWSLIEQEALPDRIGSPSTMLDRLRDGTPASIVGLGILSIILTPIVTACVIAVTLLDERDRRYGFISALVLAILLGSVALSLA
jgi:uncharacterized membrane protein